jgi:heme-degrading monooxygenase HmoA
MTAVNDRPPRHLIDTPAKAEELAAAWMRRSGFPDARVGPRGADRGIDVHAVHGLAQVKWGGSGRRGRPAVQNLYGARGHRHDKALLFFNGPSFGYTAEAVAEADKLGVGLFQYDIQGTVTAVNAVAGQLANVRPTAGWASAGRGRKARRQASGGMGCAILSALFLTIVTIGVASQALSTDAGVDRSDGMVSLSFFVGLTALVWGGVFLARYRSRRPARAARRAQVPAPVWAPPPTPPLPVGQEPPTRQLDGPEELPLVEGDVAVSPGEVTWFEYAAPLERVLEGLRAVHARLGSGQPPVYDDAHRQYTVVPDPADGFVGLVSLSAVLEPVIRDNHVVVRVHWTSRSEATAGQAAQAADDAHAAGARANRILAHHLGGWVASG